MVPAVLARMRIVKPLLVAAGLAVALPALAESSAAFPDPPAPQAAPPPATPPPAAPAPPPAPYRAPAAVTYTSTSFDSGPPAGSLPPPSSPGFGVSGSWGSGGGIKLGAQPPSAPGQDLPAGYALEEGPATTPLVIGGVTLALPYATGLGVAATQSFENGSGWLVAPVIGPWLSLGARRDPCEGASDKKEFDSDVGKCVAEPLIRGMLVLDGVLQAAGGVMLVIGASSHETHLVKKSPPPITAAPTTVGRDGYGVAVAGRF
jgi:hypothetical protein